MAVRGAKAGQVLEVRIKDVELHYDWGFTYSAPQKGALPDDFDEIHFMTIPLDMRSRHGLAVLSIIITSTPGTLWVNYDATKATLLLHVLDLVDEAVWIRTIKGRYERLLMEIFE